jgi:hypothetical protein
VIGLVCQFEAGSRVVVSFGQKCLNLAQKAQCGVVWRRVAVDLDQAMRRVEPSAQMRGLS